MNHLSFDHNHVESCLKDVFKIHKNIHSVKL